MNTIGIIGGISWVSTMDYYRIINEQVNQRLGGVQAAKILLNSVNYGDIVALTQQDNWPAITRMMCEAALSLEEAGAGCLLVGANTMHRIAGNIQDVISIPLIHIATVTAGAIHEQGLSKVALLGTRYTMELDFYPKALADYGIKLLLPEEDDRVYIHDSIYNELGKGLFLPAMRERYKKIIQSLADKGAEGVILGCTEIPQLIQQADSPVPVFNTTLLHATAAVNWALENAPADQGNRFY